MRETPDSIDLTPYLRRLGFSSLPPATLDGVRQLAYAHAMAIPFENLDALLGRGVDLAPDAVLAKLAGSRRGGWCFEHNLLLGIGLRRMGFTVADLAAQVIWFRPPGFRSPRTHRLLMLELDGRRYVADAGFGAVTLTDVLLLEPAIEQATSHEAFRFVQRGERWRLEVRLPSGWQPTYEFDLHPWWTDDFAPVNYQLAHDPESQFVKALNCARVVPEGRLGLRDADFTRWGLDGTATKRRLKDVPEILHVLESEFGIEAAPLPGIDERLARCLIEPT